MLRTGSTFETSHPFFSLAHLAHLTAFLRYNFEHDTYWYTRIDSFNFNFALKLAYSQSTSTMSRLCNSAILAVLLCLIDTSAYRPLLKIALHAQVYPADDKVVGSVITTDGLKAAFLARPEVSHAIIFYPMQYSKLFDEAWDLVVIEGWFPAIGDFIQMVRINSKSSLVFFFCLDPVYPGLDTVSRMNIDGLLTNSLVVKSAFQDVLPTQFVMLAADPLYMAPVLNSTRDWGAVYIGAGGGMIYYKYLLLDMLHSALCCGLRLHGSHWDEIPTLKDVWLGSLPRGRIPEAYSSAHTILASTTDDQRASGMINNRIFEALACGGIVISELNPAVVDTFGDIVKSITNGADAAPIIMDVIANRGSEHVENLRRRGRAAIVQRHTWHHRVVDILDLFHHVRWEQRSQRGDVEQPHKLSENNISGKQCKQLPRLAWIVSNAVMPSTDYLLIRAHVVKVLSEYYCVCVFSEDEWLLASQTKMQTFRGSFDVLMAHVYIYDNMDIALQKQWNGMYEIRNGTVVQKTIAYVYGVAPVASNAELRQSRYISFNHYDSIWYRTQADIDAIEAASGLVIPLIRRQHVFGVVTVLDPSTEPSLGFTSVAGDTVEPQQVGHNASSAFDTVVMCVFAHRKVCTSQNIRSYTRGNPYLLLLFGGQWSDWVAENKLFDFNEVDASNITEIAAYLDMITKTVHVSEGRIGDAELYIAQANELVFLKSHLAHERDIVVTGDDFSDTIWPFVVASVSYTRIRLSHGDSYTVNRIYKISSEASSSWDNGYLSTAVRRGVARLVGLTSHMSGVDLLWPLNGTLYFGTESTLGKSHVGSTELVIYTFYQNFMLGRDGQSCILVNGGHKTCLFRGTKQVNINLKWDEVSTSLPLSLFFLNEIYDSYDYNLCPNIAAGFSYLFCGLFAKADISVSILGTVFAENVGNEQLTVYIPTVLKYFCLIRSIQSDGKEEQYVVSANEKIGGITGCWKEC